MPLPLVIDTDPGIDDAVAILLALASPEIAILGLTTVLGNGPVEGCTENAIRVLDIANRADVPVHRGAAQPLARPYDRQGWSVHGADGLGGIGLPGPSRKEDGKDAIAWLARQLAQAKPGSVRLAPLGPLTNIAHLLARHPECRSAIKELVVMGGATDPAGGNVTQYAEANFHVDPEAADVVLAAGLPITLVTIETARPVHATPSRIALLEQTGTRAAKTIARLLTVYVAKSQADSLFDPLVVVYLIRPDLFGSSLAPCRVETKDPARAGQMLIDPSAKRAPIRILEAPDPDKIFALLAERLATLP
jgi:purine nucleosidase